MKFDGIIFDFDGTLFDTMFIWEQLGKNYLIANKTPPRPDFVKACEKMTLPECADYFIAEYSIPYDNKTICDQLLKMAEDFYVHKAMPKDFVPQYLNKQAKNGVKMCIATATEKELVQKALSRCGLQDYFCEIITCTQIGKSKRFPDIYQFALNVLGTTLDNTIVIEDTFHAIKTATDAGFYVIGIEDKFNAHSKSETKALCDVYVKSFKEL